MQLGPGYWTTFCYYFSTTALIVLLVSAKGLGLGAQTGIPSSLSISLGLLAGGIGAYFNRSVTLTLDFKNKKIFTATLNNALAEMGFEPKSELDNFIVYQRPTLSNIFSGKVFVEFEPNKATIVGRSANIKRLHKKMECPREGEPKN